MVFKSPVGCLLSLVVVTIRLVPVQTQCGSISQLGWKPHSISYPCHNNFSPRLLNSFDTDGSSKPDCIKKKKEINKKNPYFLKWISRKMFPLLQRTLQIYGKQGRPLHVGMSLSLPQSFTLQQDRECIVPRQFAREVVFDEFPAASRCASLRAAASRRSPTSLWVTHFAPGDRYYILYHSPCTLSWDVCGAHSRARARKLELHEGEGGGRRSGWTQKQA